MGVNAESTREHVEDDLEALAWERSGYETRIANAKAGRQERLPADELQKRIQAVDAEAKRAKALLGAARSAAEAGEFVTA